MAAKLRIKFSGRIRPEQHPAYWLSLFPNANPVIGNCEFVFDPAANDYDWFVVFEDLMYPQGSNKSTRSEHLACPRENTLIILQEPPSIKLYGPNFLRQFGHVLSPQPPEFIAHPNHIWKASPIRWFYGSPLASSDHNYVSVDHLRNMPIPNKNKSLSTVCSDKQMTPSLKARFDFVKYVSNNLGDDFDWFGRGIRPINDKAEAMDDYQYHLAIENDVFDHYWTEKIADSFLAYGLPIYHGAANISAYFDPESFLAINVHEPEQALEIIQKALTDKIYADRLPAIKRAREMVLTDYNMMNIAARIAKDCHQTGLSPEKNATIQGRHAFRKNRPIKAASDIVHRARFRTKM